MFRARPSIYQCQYGYFLVSSRFVLAPFVRYCYNSLKKILLQCYCVARDTHFSAFISGSADLTLFEAISTLLVTNYWLVVPNWSRFFGNDYRAASISYFLSFHLLFYFAQRATVEWQPFVFRHRHFAWCNGILFWVGMHHFLFVSAKLFTFDT